MKFRTKIALIALCILIVVFKLSREFYYETRETSKTIIPYSRLREDGSGATIQDMLMAHAYVFSLNLPSSTTKYIYGGACKKAKSTISSKSHENLLKEMGLLKALPIYSNCNTLIAKTLAKPDENTEFRKMWDSNEYRQYDVELFTEQWREYILGQDRKGKEGSNMYRIAVHIRRHDVGFCNQFRNRYLPNAHYLGLIDRYMEKARNNPALADRTIQVEIYSTKQSAEPWAPFQERGYQMHLDTSLSDVWTGLMTADVLIISKSSFSFVPGILNRHGTVVYTPFWHKPMSHWDVVDEAFLNKTDAVMQSLVNGCKETN